VICYVLYVKARKRRTAEAVGARALLARQSQAVTSRAPSEAAKGGTITTTRRIYDALCAVCQSKQASYCLGGWGARASCRSGLQQSQRVTPRAPSEAAKNGAIASTRGIRELLCAVCQSSQASDR
jgi:hypothetical protein